MRVSAVVLAAGASTRLRQLKQLLMLAGRDFAGTCGAGGARGRMFASSGRVGSFGGIDSSRV